MRVPLVRKEPPRRATPQRLDSPRGSPRPCVEDASYRFLQPTYDTRTRMIARFPSPDGARPSMTEPHEPTSRSPPARVDSAPDHLAAIQPRVGARLTALAQLRIARSQALPLERDGARADPPFGGATLPRRFRPRAGSAKRPSDAPCRTPLVVGPEGPTVHEAPEPLLPPSRQRGRLSRLEAPSIAECPAAAVNDHQARHRARGFATVEPASDALSLPLDSRLRRLDPNAISRGC